MDLGQFRDGDREAQDRWKRANCAHFDPGFEHFKARKSEWHGWVRHTLDGLNKTFLNMTFEDYVGDTRGSEAKLHTFAGLPPQHHRGACVEAPSIATTTIALDTSLCRGQLDHADCASFTPANCNTAMFGIAFNSTCPNMCGCPTAAAAAAITQFLTAAKPIKASASQSTTTTGCNCGS